MCSQDGTCCQGAGWGLSSDHQIIALVVLLSQQQEELGYCVCWSDGYISCQIVSLGWINNVSEIVFVLKVIIGIIFTINFSPLPCRALLEGRGGKLAHGGRCRELGMCLCSRMLAQPSLWMITWSLSVSPSSCCSNGPGNQILHLSQLTSFLTSKKGVEPSGFH